MERGHGELVDLGLPQIGTSQGIACLEFIAGLMLELCCSLIIVCLSVFFVLITCQENK